MQDLAVLRTVIMTVIGVIAWCIAWSRHKRYTDYGANHYVVRVPAWLSWLCGRPLPDNQVELEFMVFQLLDLLFILLWVPLLILLRLKDPLALVLIALFFMLPLVALAVRFVVGLVVRQS